MLGELVGCLDVGCVGGMLGGMKECWLGWGDVGWVGKMVDGLVECWVR